MTALKDIEAVTLYRLRKYGVKELLEVKEVYLKNLRAANEAIAGLSDEMTHLTTDIVEIRDQKANLKYYCDVRGLILAKLRAVNARLDEVEVSCMC